MAFDFKIGDRWILTTPGGREIEHRVAATQVKPKYQHKPGNCVRLIALDGSIADAVMWPEDILAAGWLCPTGGSDES